MAKIGFRTQADAPDAPDAPSADGLPTPEEFDRMMQRLAQRLGVEPPPPVAPEARRAPRRRAHAPRIDDSRLPVCVVTLHRLSPVDGLPEHAEIVSRGWPIMFPAVAFC